MARDEVVDVVDEEFEDLYAHYLGELIIHDEDFDKSILAHIAENILPWYPVRYDTITRDGGSVYMERWHLEEGVDRNVRIHHILRSDSDRDMHDHPWDFTSRLLHGAYMEWTGAGRDMYRPGDTIQRSAEHQHRLELGRGEDGVELGVWTFVVTGPARRKWGFQVGDTWVPWKKYRGAGGYGDGKG